MRTRHGEDTGSNSQKKIDNSSRNLYSLFNIMVTWKILKVLLPYNTSRYNRPLHYIYYYQTLEVWNIFISVCYFSGFYPEQRAWVFYSGFEFILWVLLLSPVPTLRPYSWREKGIGLWHFIQLIYSENFPCLLQPIEVLYIHSVPGNTDKPNFIANLLWFVLGSVLLGASKPKIN